MNVILKRRQLILATLVVALGAAVFVNWYYTGNNSLENDGTTDSEYVQNLGEAKYVNATENTNSFEQMKFERQKSHDLAVSNFNESLSNAAKGSPEAKEITKSINELTDTYKMQEDIELLIKNAVKSESYVTISKKTVDVVVTKGTLNENTSLKILEIITSNTDVESENVTISEQ